MKLIDCTLSVGAPGPTVNDCCTCGAALQVASPGWLASIVQVPAAANLTVAPESEHTELLAESIVNVTAMPLV